MGGGGYSHTRGSEAENSAVDFSEESVYHHCQDAGKGVEFKGGSRHRNRHNRRNRPNRRNRHGCLLVLYFVGQADRPLLRKEVGV